MIKKADLSYLHHILAKAFLYKINFLVKNNKVSLFILGGLTVTSVVGLVRAITLFQVKGKKGLKTEATKILMN